MEICGGQTHSIMKYNLPELLSDKINLVHGPGCPVCVTPVEIIDKAIYISRQSNVILCSFGDMLRVPGSDSDLLREKANGADIRIVYSPLDAVTLAEKEPESKVVFFAVGFETTAPAVALAINQANLKKLKNFFIISSHVLVPPAMEAILSSPENRIQGFLAAGHVCTVMGYHEYHAIAQKYKVPISVTGFEPVDILMGILKTIEQLEKGKYEVVNAYGRSVTEQGNIPAQEIMNKIFNKSHQVWRGIGLIPESGLQLKPAYAKFDISSIINLNRVKHQESGVCIAGEILQGIHKPFECIAFGKECTPEKPLGAPMVSTEGACAAYYRFHKIKVN